MKKYMIDSTSCFVTLGIFFLTFVLFFGIKTAQGARIKDLAAIKGIRSNQLTGYGLIVGLDGTGDKSGADFTTQALANMMDRMGVHVDKNQLKVKNIAAVIVTADIPAFARIGNKIDIVASSIGDAKSLAGGTLLLTPLKGVDGQVYALAQGPVTLGGRQRRRRRRNHPEEPSPGGQDRQRGKCGAGDPRCSGRQKGAYPLAVQS